MKALQRFIIIGSIFLFSQFPLYVDQYCMRLEGHISESKRAVEMLRETASSRGKTLPEYTKKFLDSSDLDIKAQGTFMQGLQDRLVFLESALRKIRDAASVARPFVFCVAFDSRIASETLKGFKPGLLFSEDIILWGIVGAIVGFVICVGIRRRKAPFPTQKNLSERDNP